MVKLYKDGKVEPNTGRRNWGDGPSGNILGAAMFPPPQQYLNPNCTPRERDEFFCKTKLGKGRFLLTQTFLTFASYEIKTNEQRHRIPCIRLSIQIFNTGSVRPRDRKLGYF